MSRNNVVTLSFLLLLVMGQAVRARAADSCQIVLDAIQKLVTTPSHSYTTSTAAKSGSPQTGETIMTSWYAFYLAYLTYATWWGYRVWRLNCRSNQ